jgi:chromatin segregation and condensation protein Rec8/ScpA/Scc1 (kleisin family)
MLSTNESERADLLEMSFLSSALKKTVREYERERKLRNHREILKRGRHFLGCIIAGSLFSTREDREKLLPEGAGLYESVRAYGFARRTWSSNTVLPKDLSHEKAVERLRLYAACLEDIERGTSLDEWKREQREALTELAAFFASLENILVGELNSRSVEAIGRPF